MYFRAIVVFLILFFLAPAIWAKDIYILHKPKPEEKEVRCTYENEDYSFGFDLKDGFTFVEESLDEGVFNLLIELKDYPLQAAITVEPLDDELTSIGYWRKVQQRDPNMADDLVYERSMDIAGVDATQVRLEGSGEASHYLILSVVFSNDGKGYILSCFTDTKYFDKVPDFLDEVSQGFYFLDDDSGDGNTETDDEGSNNAEESP